MKCLRLHCSVLSFIKLETCIPDSPSQCGSGVELAKGDPGLWSRKQRAAGFSAGQMWTVPTRLWSSSRSSRQQLDIYCPAVVGWGTTTAPSWTSPELPTSSDVVTKALTSDSPDSPSSPLLPLCELQFYEHLLCTVPSSLLWTSGPMSTFWTWYLLLLCEL